MSTAKADPLLKGCLYSPDDVAKHSNWMFQVKCARTSLEHRSARKGLLADFPESPEGSCTVHSVSARI